MNGFTPDELRVEVAHRQLQCIRAGQAARATKRGTRLFAFGWLEKLRPGGGAIPQPGHGVGKPLPEATQGSAGRQATAPEPIT